MDDSEIIPRPPAEKFAYHRCIPTLLSLAIEKASYEDIEKHVPSGYLVYDYALAFKDEPIHANPLESLKLDFLAYKINEEAFVTSLSFFFYMNNHNKKDNLRVCEHILAHTRLRQESLDQLLSQADMYKKTEEIKVLVQWYARGRFFDRWQENPLHNAIVRHAFLGENLTFKHTENGSLHYAVMSGNHTIKTGEINEHNVNFYTPLMLAAAYNLAEVVKKLAPFASQKNKDESLCCAAEYGACAVIDPLIANSANVNAISLFDSTPLNNAAAYGNTNTAELLIARGANVHAKTNNGITPLLWAQNKDLTTILIRYGADINARDFKGCTPLHYAAMTNDISRARVLLNSGALVDAETIKKKTPLHLASTSTFIAMTRLLIAHGANVHAKDEEGKTPFDLVQKNIRGGEKRRDTIISLLKQAQQ